MKPIVRALFLPLLMMAAVLLFGQSLAIADDGAAAPSSWAMLWPLLALACGTVGAWVRAYTPSTGFWHQWYGHLLLMLIGALLGSLGPMFQAGLVTQATLLSALIGGVTAFVSALKPNGTGAGAKLSVFLPLIVLPSLLAAGCQTPGGQALKTCEMGQLPAAEQAVLAEVGVVLLNPASVVADLVALATQLGPAQVGCAVQAWDAYLASKNPPASASKLMAAAGADQRTHAQALAHAYLATHPSACSARAVASLARSIDEPLYCWMQENVLELAVRASDWL